MTVPMVGVRPMCMAVDQFQMLVLMDMRSGNVLSVGVGMAVVLVLVSMLMRVHFMIVLVLVPVRFARYEPGADYHQECCREDHPSDPFSEQHQREYRAKVRGRAEKGTRARRAHPF